MSTRQRFGLFTVFTVFTLFIATSALSSSSPMEEIEGALEVVMATEVSQKSCKPLYFINTGGKRMQFSLPAHAPPNLSPGQKIKISGRWDDDGAGKKSFHCRKVATVAAAAPAVKKAVSLTDSASCYLPKQNPVLGEQRTLVVLIAFPDHDVPEWDKEKAENKVFYSEPTSKYPNDHSDNAYWKECSGDKMWLTGKCLDGWKSMPKNASEYGYGSNDELGILANLKMMP